MRHPRLASTASCLAALVATGLPAVASAAEPAAELDQLRSQVNDLRQSYEARLQALERRIQELQQQAAAPPPPPVPPPLAAPSANASTGSASAFNPAVSLILNGTYANLSHDPDRYRLQGFVPSGGEVGPGRRGFQIGESELTLAANVDPTFSGRLTASIEPDDTVSVEEAVFEKQSLFEGATLKAGRFLSSIGYLNSQHAHAWDFVDAPLAYQAFFGGPLKTDGLHLHWLAPTDRYLELGAEVGSGSTYPGSSGGRNGIGAGAMYAHVGDDIGESASWRAGLSFLHHRATERAYDDVDANGNAVVNSFSGHSRTWVADAIYKWSPGGNGTQRNLKVQGEYFRRTEDGTLTVDTTPGDYRHTQSGWYVQAVYQFMPMWRLGLRYDRLDSGSPGLFATTSPILGPYSPTRTTVMTDWSLSEFSRLRLQLAADRSNPDGTDRQLYLQYIMSLGAHGAHSF